MKANKRLYERLPVECFVVSARYQLSVRMEWTTLKLHLRVPRILYAIQRFVMEYPAQKL